MNGGSGEPSRSSKPVGSPPARPRRKRIKRGILATELSAARAFAHAPDPELVTENAFKALVSNDIHQVKDRMDYYRRLARGEGDIRGRRLFEKNARSDARYIAHIAYNRLHVEAQLTPRQESLLHNAIRRVQHALRESYL